MEGRSLSEEDLKLVARLGNLLTQRPQGPRGQTMNHKVRTYSSAFMQGPCVKHDAITKLVVVLFAVTLDHHFLMQNCQQGTCDHAQSSQRDAGSWHGQP